MEMTIQKPLQNGKEKKGYFLTLFALSVISGFFSSSSLFARSYSRPFQGGLLTNADGGNAHSILYQHIFLKVQSHCVLFYRISLIPVFLTI